MSDPDLSLVPLDTLLDELKNRYDNFLFCGNGAHSPTENQTRFKYEGSFLILLGMFQCMTHKLNRDMDEQGREMTGEEADT